MLPPFPADAPPEAPRPDRGTSFLHWLAGARWETLRLCPPSERERVAVLGSTILIPTLMAFFGMYFFARSRFADPPFLTCLTAASAWATVILGTDRILLATYRPFQPWWRKSLQVAFRFALAAVVSVAISFPFCLDAYRPAIAHRYQTEIQGVLNDLRQDEAATRKSLTSTFQTTHDEKIAQLAPLETAILNSDTYADQKIEEEKQKISADGFLAPASPPTRRLLTQIDASKERLATLQSDQTDAEALHRRLVEALARESNGLPNEFFPEPKKAGEGPRTKDLQRRDLAASRDLDRLAAALTQESTTLASFNSSLAAARLIDRNTLWDSLPERRAAFIQEAKERERTRQEKLARLTAEITLHTQDHTRALRLHDDRYLPPIARYETKIKGVLDPMEETIGLYKVIFLPPPDALQTNAPPFQWVAGLFQFLVVFGTLFVLDLVPIMAKIFSRPGPYDVLVEQSELVCNLNLRAFKKLYPSNARRWATTGNSGHSPSHTSILQTHLFPEPAPPSD